MSFACPGPGTTPQEKETLAWRTISEKPADISGAAAVATVIGRWKSLATAKAGAPRELDGPTSVSLQWGEIATARHLSLNLGLLLGRRDHSGYQRLLSEMTLQVPPWT